MRIDCHCHIFDNDCVPMIGVMASRFGVTVGKKTIKLMEDLKTGRIVRPWWDYFSDISVNPKEVLNSLTDQMEKDNLHFILNHFRDFLGFLEIGMQKMDRILEKIKTGSRAIDIWVPLMMNMEYAYPGNRSVRGFKGQQQMMSRLTLESKGQMMPFYAFDPRSGPEDPVEAAKTALEHQGFVGIKLYPPLGFKPINNNDPKVDDTLTRLYTYCCSKREHPIPITAHCSWSAGIYSNELVPGVNDIKTYYRDMASPIHWEKVLKRFPSLKLNLAHFGGLGEWQARAGGAQYTENWADIIVRLMKEYKNVYTDLSYHGLPTTDLAEDYKTVLLKKIEGVEQKVLLGSDWYMSRMQCELAEYWQGFEALFPGLFATMAGENAVAFLKSDATTRFFPSFFAANRSEIPDKYKDLFRR